MQTNRRNTESSIGIGKRCPSGAGDNYNYEDRVRFEVTKPMGIEKIETLPKNILSMSSIPQHNSTSHKPRLINGADSFMLGEKLMNIQQSQIQETSQNLLFRQRTPNQFSNSNFGLVELSGPLISPALIPSSGVNPLIPIIVPTNPTFPGCPRDMDSINSAILKISKAIEEVENQVMEPVRESSHFSQYYRNCEDQGLSRINHPFENDFILPSSYWERRQLQEQQTEIDEYLQLSSIPSVEDLSTMPLNLRRRIEDFTIFNHFGKIKFLSVVDLSNIFDPSILVAIGPGEVEFYPQLKKKIVEPRGKGINVPMLITLYELFDGTEDQSQFISREKEFITKAGGVFISFDPLDNTCQYYLQGIPYKK